MELVLYPDGGVSFPLLYRYDSKYEKDEQYAKEKYEAKGKYAKDKYSKDEQ
jgi:hypothetical protein